MNAYVKDDVLFCPRLVQAVLRWLERLGIPLRDRGEVAGQVWLSAWRSWPTFDPKRATPERWLNRITVHVASHYRERAYHRREELTDEYEPIEAVDFIPDAGSVLAATESRARVIEALSELDPQLRFLLVKHYFEEIPLAKLAETVGLPLSTIYKRRARALAALCEALQRREAEEARMIRRRRGRK